MSEQEFDREKRYQAAIPMDVSIIKPSSRFISSFPELEIPAGNYLEKYLVRPLNIFSLFSGPYFPVCVF